MLHLCAFSWIITHAFSKKLQWHNRWIGKNSCIWVLWGVNGLVNGVSLLVIGHSWSIDFLIFLFFFFIFCSYLNYRSLSSISMQCFRREIFFYKWLKCHQTWLPRRSSSLANGIIPKMISAPELSTNMITCHHKRHRLQL